MSAVGDMSPAQKRALLAKLLERKAAANETLPLSLSHGQRSLWFLHRLAPDSSAYNVAFAFRSRTKLDQVALRWAFQALLDRHAILRTTYSAGDHGPVQQVADRAEVFFQHVDAAGDNDTELHDRIMRQVSAPFDLESGPVMRVHLFSRAEDDHVQVVTIHHIACDLWSSEQLLKELRILYAAQSRGETVNLPELPSDYAEFVRWQDEMLESRAGEDHWRYWKEKLAGDLPAIELPFDFPRPQMQTFAGSSIAFDFDEGLVKSARSLASNSGATIYTVFLAAFFALLHRYSRQTDIIIGTPTLGRPRKRFEEIVGYFVNPVVFRANLSNDLTFADLLAATKQTVVEALDHQDYPFPLLVERLGVERDPSRAPLTDVFFVWDRMREDHNQINVRSEAEGDMRVSLDWGDIELESFGLTQVGTPSDLALLVVEHGDSLAGHFAYNTDLFQPPTAEAMVDHFRTLLSDAVARPTALISQLRLMDDSAAGSLVDQTRPIEEVNEKGGVETLHGAFESLVSEHGERAAVTTNDVSLSYSELNARANQLAHRLQEMGVSQGDRVALSTPRSWEALVGLIGILKVGASYVPLDPIYPLQRRQLMVEDSGATVLVTVGALESDIQGCASIVLDNGSLDGHSTDNLQHVGLATDHAYVIYTSGSTGRPKGVAVTHHCVTRLIETTKRLFDFSERDVWTLFHSYSFDFSVWEIWGALLYGGRLVIVPEEVAQSPDRFCDLVVSEGVTVLNQTPSAFRQLDWAEERRRKNVLDSLKWVIFGGEELDYGSLRSWFERHGDQRPRLVNMYGITETTVHVTYREVGVADAVPNAPSLIGKPLPDLSLRVLDERLQPCPVGVPGELFVGGAGVADGYLNREELTRARFIESPFSVDQGDILYRTGDLARRRADGDIEYLGRIDTQVQIRGYRIELGEIRTVLESVDGVAQAVVDVRERSLDDKTIVAYLVPDRPGAVDEAAVRSAAEKQLPSYMRPAAIVEIETVPLTANGKVDRSALPKPGTADVGNERFVAPRSAVEKRIAEIWRDVLGAAEISVHHNFFDLGGHSLLATRIIVRINESFDIDLPLAAFFQAPSIAAVAEQVAELERAATALDVADTADDGEREEFEL